MLDPSQVRIVKPRPTVEIHLPDDVVLCGPRGALVGDFIENIRSKPVSNQTHNEDPPIVGAIVNGELRELTYPIKMDASVEPVTMGQADGMRIYRRSLTFLLETAFEHFFPDAKMTIDHSVSSGGYFCQVTGRPPLSASELGLVEARMRELVDQDLPLKRMQVPIQDAIIYFKEKGHDDKVRLLAHRKKDYLTIYELNGNRDYYHGYMVSSTGYMRWFGLVSTGEGFTLRFPRRHRPTELLPLPEYPKLLATFRQYGDWLWRLGIQSVGSLNDAIQSNRIREIVLVSEALHEQRIADIAAQVAAQTDKIRVVLVAGPSSSGKTTFSKRLSIQMLAQGISPLPLGMDNYFLNRENTPRDEHGELDFESIQALDRARLKEDISRLISGERVQIPHYNFKTGQREPGEEVLLDPGQIIILEGIHGLNPDLLPDFPQDRTFRIYVSALTQLNLDRHNRVSTTDTRLLRRIIRDARERGYNAQDTFQRWESVRRGEKRYIFPYQENADIMFNSAMAYEISVLKPLAEPLLRQVPFGCSEYVEAKRLLSFLEWFEPLNTDLVPDNSILREFVGGSILQDFKLWHNHNR